MVVMGYSAKQMRRGSQQGTTMDAATEKEQTEKTERGSLSEAQRLNALVLLGVGLRLWEYIFNRSLYLDEILLTRSIVGMPLRELLTKPLLMDQVAPRGFLLIERLVVIVFGPSEVALRL